MVKKNRMAFFDADALTDDSIGNERNLKNWNDKTQT